MWLVGVVCLVSSLSWGLCSSRVCRWLSGRRWSTGGEESVLSFGEDGTVYSGRLGRSSEAFETRVLIRLDGYEHLPVCQSTSAYPPTRRVSTRCRQLQEQTISAIRDDTIHSLEVQRSYDSWCRFATLSATARTAPHWSGGAENRHW